MFFENVFLDGCYLKPDHGSCHASLTRYYFNKDTKSCETFTYGGCEGNSNNFEVEELCLLNCKGRE